MINKLRSAFALTEQGAKDLLRGSLWCAAANISLMFPVGLLVIVLRDMLYTASGGTIGSLLIDGAAVVTAGSIVKDTVFAALLVVLIFVIHWIQYGSVYIATYVESANRRVALGEKLRQLPLSFFGQRNLSDLTNTIMSDCSALEQAFSHNIPELFGACISTTLIALGLLFMDWRLALAALWVIPAAVLLTVGSKRVQDRWGKVGIEAKRVSADGIQECLETIQDIKACNQKERYLEGLMEKFRRAEAASIRSELMTGVFVTGSQMFLRLGLVSIVLVGGILLVSGETDLLTFLVFLIAGSRLYDPLSTVMINVAALFNAGLQIGRMKAMDQEPVQTGTERISCTGYDICFDRVSFAYRSGETVLRDVSFTARQGEVTALVGPSGSGKSTAARLAARFWDVTGGRITLGGTDIGGVEPETLLKNYSIVFQDVVLFHDTVMENIRLGRRTASDEEVKEAARAAQCDDFIRRLPQGYETVMGENGSTLSGGERQRISIARALLKNAPVILLDEATASLDVENETQVQAAISRLVKDKTVLIIAHRMRTVAGADHIVVLEEGGVSQQGSPAELMEQGGLYRHMVELQRESAGWRLSGK